MIRNSISYIFFVSVWLASSCQTSSNGQQKSKEKTAAVSNFDYDLTSPKTYKLNSALDEISGIAFHPENANLIYAIQDEEGKLFTYDLMQSKIVDEFSFGKNGDYEDIATDGKYFYILKSNGDIHYFPVNHNKNKANVEIVKNVLPKGEYESLALNPLDQSLLVLCKDCKVDKSNGRVTGYKFSLQQNKLSTTFTTFTLDIDSLRKWDENISKTIKPSAMTFNAVKKEWYIISSIDKILIVTNDAFQPTNILTFTRNQFEQPEGLAINNSGDLFISSEIGDSNAAAIYQFKSNK